MDLTQLVCPLCGGSFQVEIRWQGEQVACPLCHGVVVVPMFSESILSSPLEVGMREPAIEPGEIVSIQTDATNNIEDERDAPRAPDVEASVAASSTTAVDAILDERRQPTTAESPFSVHETERSIVTSAGEKVVFPQRTPHEKARRRRRLSLVVALGAAILLAIVFIVLLQLR